MPLDLDAIEARCAAATEEPWDRDGSRFARGVVFVCPRPQDGGVFECAANRRFIAAARDDVPALVARVRELEAALAEIAAAAEESARAMDLLHANERHLAFWPMLTRLRDLRRLAERAAHPDALTAPEGGA